MKHKGKLLQDAAGEQGKRMRTRALLMDCAIMEFGTRGIGKTSIDDIATTAKVSHGTFYYHFSNKEEIVEAVGRAVAAGLAELVDRQIRGIASGPERVAMATQVFIRGAAAIPEWGWLIARAIGDMGTFYEVISRGIRKDVLIGLQAHEFNVEPSRLLFSSLLAVVGTAVHLRLERPEKPNIERDATILLLRMLGLQQKEVEHLPDYVIERYGDLGVSQATIETDMKAIMPVLLDEIVQGTEGEQTVA
ncbi:TetR/AcrR family transcriptional regulator [Roseibium litorale]|uniref:TetR/AcrR family transcriptional regulator n=1 Tax=Roseibium litorale TaxID=2803841 RepID=A0ABR9CR72_9HYPH|nr:TetR/AcrR family transcriptional regulator [Roseibium litorale]MBD8893376.1 TetR/AcrR family transcriptional regulator [Roseibium litorale]